MTWEIGEGETPVSPSLTVTEQRRENMGEIAEMMLDGTLCVNCGEYLGSDNGFPTSCGCQGDDIDDDELDDIPEEARQNIEALEYLFEAVTLARKNPNAKKVRVELVHLERLLKMLAAAALANTADEDDEQPETDEEGG